MIVDIQTIHLIIMLAIFCITTFGFVFLTTYRKQSVSGLEYVMFSFLNACLSVSVVLAYGPVLLLSGISLGIFLLIYLSKKLSHYIMLNLKKSD